MMDKINLMALAEKARDYLVQCEKDSESDVDILWALLDDMCAYIDNGSVYDKIREIDD